MGFSLHSIFSRSRSKSKNPSRYAPLAVYAETANCHFFVDVPLFHHNESVTFPFLLIDRYRGAVLIEELAWDFKSLQGVKASEARKGTRKKDIEVDRPRRIFARKLDTTLCRQECRLESFVYFSSLTAEEFSRLDPSFHRLIPANLAIFSDEPHAAIFEKLSAPFEYRDQPLDMEELQRALFIQYTLLPDELYPEHRQLTPQQKHYLDAELPARSLLMGSYGSGKSSVLLLKALYEQLRRPDLSITLVLPTQTACEQARKRLLEIIEHAVVHLDPTAIRIVTPEFAVLDASKRALPDLLFIDDAHLIPSVQLGTIAKMCKKGGLHLSAAERPALDVDTLYPLNHNFRLPRSLEEALFGAPDIQPGPTLDIFNGNGFILTLHRLRHLLKRSAPGDIMLVVPDRTFGAALSEEIAEFSGLDTTLLDPRQSLLNQRMEQLLVVAIGDTGGLQRKDVIVIADTGSNDPEQIRHALSRAARSACLIYHSKKKG